MAFHKNSPVKYCYAKHKKPELSDRPHFDPKPHMMPGITADMLMSGRAKPAKGPSE